MSENNVLREATNDVEIVGNIKKINLEEKKSKKGDDIIIGDVQIEVQEEGKIHVHRVKVFSKKFKNNGELNGLYKGYKTVKDEYSVGQKVRVTGDLRLEEYHNQSGNIISYNSVSALFFNRVEDGEEFRPKSIATIEMVIEGMESEIDAEGLPTGRLTVDAFTVGYQGRIIPLLDVIIEEGLSSQFKNMYFPGTTGRITMKINNYAEAVENETLTEDVQTGFGSAERVESNVVNNYTNNLEIIGGDLPYDDGVNEYSPADIEQAHKNRALALQQLKSSATASAEPTGFGATQPNNKEALKDALGKTEEKVEVTSDDLPDF